MPRWQAYQKTVTWRQQEMSPVLRWQEYLMMVTWRHRLEMSPVLRLQEYLMTVTWRHPLAMLLELRFQVHLKTVTWHLLEKMPMEYQKKVTWHYWVIEAELTCRVPREGGPHLAVIRPEKLEKRWDPQPSR